MKISELKETYKCDKCKGEFPAATVQLAEPANNFDSISAFYVYNIISEKIYQTVSSKITEGDMMVACPLCNHVHLFGFDTVAA